jgi:sugar-specific transcriptional regulator TrmB
MAKDLAKKTAIPRTLLYHVLRQLEAKGLVISKKSTEYAWRTTFSAEDPRHLYKLLKRQEADFVENKNAIHELVPLLSHTYRSKHARPHVTQVDGVAGYAAILEGILQTQPQCIYTYFDPSRTLPGIDVRDRFDRRRVLRKVLMHVLCSDSNEVRSFIAKRSYDVYTQFRVLPKDIPLSHAGVVLYVGGCLYESASEHEPSVVHIEDDTLARMQVDLFTHLWKQSTPITLTHIHI